MKITLELEIGVETGVVIASLEALIDVLNSSNTQLTLYTDVASRLKNEVMEKVDMAKTNT